MSPKERKITDIPLWVLFGFVVFLSLQLAHHYYFKTNALVSYKSLNPPRSLSFYRVMSLGSEQLASYLLLIGVQLHDNQKGRHVNYRHIDYQTLSDWLLLLYKMNPASDYPGFLASRIYGQIKDPVKVRMMIEVIRQLFEQDPARHWRRMTEACLLAKHQLKDLPLALELAKEVADLPKSVALPFWARDMKLVLLDELNELESAQLLISSLLQSGEIKDPDELRFLKFRLLKIQQQMLSNRQQEE